jgi:hypothetical protein
MATYHVHRIRQDGWPRPGEPLDAEDDSEAIELIRLRLDPRACELWHGTRKVALIPPEGGAPILSDSPAFSFGRPNPAARADPSRKFVLHSCS